MAAMNVSRGAGGSGAARFSLHAAGALTRRIAAAVTAWRDRARERDVLAGLDERLLNDIGVTRADVMREVSKPFWR